MGGGPPPEVNVSLIETESTVSTISTSCSSNMSPNIVADLQICLLYAKSKVYLQAFGEASGSIPGYFAIYQKLPNDYFIGWIPEPEVDTSDIESYLWVEANPFNPTHESSSMHSIIISPTIIDKTPSLSLISSLDEVTRMTLFPPTEALSGMVLIELKNLQRWPCLWFHNSQYVSDRSWVGEEMANWLEIIKTWQNGKKEFDYTIVQISASSKSNHDNTTPPISDLTEISSTSTSSFHLQTTSGNLNRNKVEEVKNGDITPVEVTPFGTIGVLEDEATETITPGESTSTRREGFSPSLLPSMITDPIVSHLQEARWNVLNQFSKVTKFSRSTTAQILEHPLAKPVVPYLPVAVREFAENSPSTREFINDYQPAAYYLKAWLANAIRQAKKNAFSRVEPRERFSQNFELNDMGGQRESSSVGEFEIIMVEGAEVAEPAIKRLTPITVEDWFAWLDEEGRPTLDKESLLERIFIGGIENDLRPFLWPFLLEVYPWSSTEEERREIRSENREFYQTIKAKWVQMEEIEESPEQTEKLNILKEQQHRIHKDVLRTDRGSIELFPGRKEKSPKEALEAMDNILTSYFMYDPELGYVQGMSDLLSPIFVIMRDEADSFSCFSAFMRRMTPNFEENQNGMREQMETLELLIRFMLPELHEHLASIEALHLFFCFRWLLIWFKREFNFENVMRLWEILWTNHLSAHFHLFVALAILDQHQYVIIQNFKDFDEVLKYVNDLALTLNVEATLIRAEKLFREFQRAMALLDALSTPMVPEGVWRGFRTVRTSRQEMDVGEKGMRKSIVADLGEFGPLRKLLMREVV